MEVLGECIAELLHAEARSDPGPALARARACIARLTRDGDGEGSDTLVPGVIDSAGMKELVVAARAAATGGER